MTDIQDSPTSWRDSAQLLLRDLTCISGTLSEITTVWRRAKPYLPWLPLTLPVQLQDAARSSSLTRRRPQRAGSPRYSKTSPRPAR
jgi:hypothetical protein